MRPEGNPSLWGQKGIKPDSVQQGKLGDFWFLATAAAIAEQPERIKDIFVVQKFTNSGIFAVKFWVKGLPYIQTIDSKIPVMDNNTPINARPTSQGAWWPVLLEKAFAKLNLNYANLEGGHPYEAMRILTGHPVMQFHT